MYLIVYLVFFSFCLYSRFDDVVFGKFSDNGGGMNPEKMRHCMSLGYSAKSKLANTIGQCKATLLPAIFYF